MAGWGKCPLCAQLVKNNMSQSHKCPDAAIIMREIKIEEEVEDQMMFFDIQIDNFWENPQTKFIQHLIDQGQL